MEISSKQGPSDLVNGLTFVSLNHLQPFPLETYLLDQSSGIGRPFPSTGVPLSVTARSPAAGDQIDDVCPSFYGPQELQCVDAAAAGQREESNPLS